MTGDDMTDHAVVIVGSGPTGLMLAGELALAAGEEQTIEFVFAVDYPRDMQIAGLPD